MQHTYATLCAALESMVEDELDLPLVIGMGEARALLDLDLDIFSGEATGDAGALIQKPASFHYLRSGLHLTTTSTPPTIISLERRTYSYVREFSPSALVTGTPKFFADADDGNFAIAPAPAAGAYTYSYGYAIRPAGLSESNATTWLSTHAADLLQLACLISAHEYLKNDERVQLGMAEYKVALSRYMEEFAGMRTSRLSPTKTIIQEPSPSGG